MSALFSEENRFTHYVKGSTKSEGYKILEKWLEWFHQRRIPAVLVRDKTGYAVYRSGMIPVEPDPQDQQEAE